MTENRTDIKSMTLPELEEYLSAAGEPKYRAAQLFRWMHATLAAGPEEMTNLPKTLLAYLSEDCTFNVPHLADRQISKIDGTQKFLFELGDGELVESVLMEYKFGCSVCVSSQVGCRMGCRFCASTLNGWKRNLTASEILEQIYSITRIAGKRISHAVVMGTGEPMDNYDSVVRFIRLLTDPAGQGLSQRNITVSTCGIVPGIRKLAEEDLSVTLALSLHAVTDEKRRQIMPVAEKWTIAECLDAMRYYFDRTGRQVTLEYSLIRGVNDSVRDAAALAGLAGPLHAHVNLIPVNPVRERDCAQPTGAAVNAFRAKLEKRKINVTIRRELGRDIDGACGQLRRRHIDTDA
ncbi:MAG: 23S rRNA (adenine(2503)-C(2))-methyltransferase RlmN [Lachnospiraceae bacterium]|nr:23S rRNA (adenine(2503)-C(2))-methyltransferase RlmN [Lachnospiraceae bacterium]